MRILGLDLGSTSVKAVELDSAFGGRFEIRDYYEQKTFPGEDPAQTATRLIASLPKPADKVAVAMRTNQVTFRNIQLPTRDKKSIQAGIGFELEDELPFPLEQSVYDYSILSQAGQSSQIHVGVTLKRHLTALIAHLNSVGVDPDLITPEAWSFRALFNRILSPTIQDKPVLLVQIGHERTLFYIHWHGMPILIREIPFGGHHLTVAICQKYSLTVEEAENAKLGHGFLLSSSQRDQATSEQTEFSEAILQPVLNLIREIRQVELACKSITHQNLSMIYISGGTSLLPGLAKGLEENLQLPVKPIHALSSLSPSGVTYSEQTDATFMTAASLALCLVGSEKSTGINLRKGEFAKENHTREINLQALKRPLMATGAVLSCFFISLIVQSRVYQSQIKNIDGLLEKNIRSFFGQISNSAVRTYLSDTQALRTSVNKELNKTRELAKLLGPNPRSPTDFLKSISSSLSKNEVLDLIQFQVGAAATSPYSPARGSESEAVSLTFLVSNPQIAEQITNSLGNKMSGMQRSKIEEAPSAEGGPKRWKVTFTGKPTETAYGK